MPPSPAGAGLMAVSNLRINAPGLAKLRRDLGRIDRGLRTAADRHIRQAANRVRDTARSKAPRRTGRLSKSIRTSVRARGASIYSNLEYAPVHEWGGTISPRGTPITIEASHYMAEAVEENTDMIEEELGRLLDGIADRHGFT